MVIALHFYHGSNDRGLFCSAEGPSFPVGCGKGRAHDCDYGSYIVKLTRGSLQQAEKLCLVQFCCDFYRYADRKYNVCLLLYHTNLLLRKDVTAGYMGNKNKQKLFMSFLFFFFPLFFFQPKYHFC